MAIDTRYVAIVPRFDTKAFTRIKRLTESIGKGLANIQVGYKFNARSLSGLKTKINAELKSKKFAIHIPVNYNFNRSSLAGLKGQLKSTILSSNFKADIPVRFNIRGAKKDLQEQIQRFRVTPFIAPITLRATRDSVDRVRRQAFQLGNSGQGGGSNNNSRNEGSNRFGGGGQSTFSATKDIARYGVGFAILSEASRLITSPVGLESRLNSIVATINNDRKSQKLPELTESQISKLRSEIVDIASGLPTTILEVADAAKSLAKAGITFDQIIGGATRETARAGVAGEESLASTADFTARMLEVFEEDFKGEINQSNAFKNISKVLIGTIETTLFDLVDVQQAFKQGASGARAAGLTGAEFGALLASVSAMSTGSDVGTSLKTFLRFLTVPKSSEAEAALDELGLDPFDSKGKIKNIREIIKLMEELNKSTDEDRLRIISDIFGQDASRAADLLSFKGLDEFLKAYAAIESTDIDKILSTKLQGVEAQFILMRASLEKLYVSLFDPEALKGTATIIESISSDINDVAEKVQKMGGMTGVWKELKDSDFMEGLILIKDAFIEIAKAILYISKTVENTKSLNNIMSSVNPNSMMLPTNDNVFMGVGSSIRKGLIDLFSTPTPNQIYNPDNAGSLANASSNTISGNTIYVTPPPDGNPQEYGEAVMGALSLRMGGARIDDVLSSGLGTLTP